MNDTTRRFLNTVLQRVPEGRIVDVRLFPAMRQGGIESGVAVLAVEAGFDAPSEPVAPPDAVIDGEISVGDDPGISSGERLVTLDAAADDVADEELLVDETAIGEVEPRELVPLSEVVLTELEREAALEVARDGVAEESAALAADFAEAEVAPERPTVASEVVMADAPPADGTGEETIALGDILALPSPGPAPEAAGEEPARVRLAILCARYRLVFKGPDRGKYDLEIVHQADAPLDTLDRVIAGVVRRSGEGSEPVRYTRESLRAALDAPAWAEA